MNTANLLNCPVSSLANANQRFRHSIRIILTGVIASIVTMALFWLMSQVLNQSGEHPIESDPFVLIDPVFSEREIKTVINEPLPPKPTVVEPPKILSRDIEPSDSDDNLSIGTTFEVVTPKADTSPNTVLSLTEGDARPIVRISPQYPVQPAREGIEGWVQLSFSINELGGVEDISVVDAEPKRVFNRAAIRALRKWKYRPKMIDGKSVKQVNMFVRLDFNLEGSDAQ